MYALLQFVAEDVIAPWRVKFFLSLEVTLPDLSVQQATERGKALRQLKTEVPGITSAEMDNLSQLCRALPASEQDVMSNLYLGLAHLRLPEALRKERENRIAKALDSFFKGVPQIPQFVSGIKFIKLIAPLAPDAYLEIMVCSQATRLQMIHASLPELEPCCTSYMHRLDDLTIKMGIESRSPEDRLMFDTLFSRSWTQREGFMELTASAAQFGLADAVRKTELALRDHGYLMVSEGDILVSVLKDCIEAKLDGSMRAEIEAVVANRVALGHATELARIQMILGATITAIRDEVPMGKTLQTRNQEAIASARQALWQHLLRMTPQRLRLCKEKDHSLATHQATTDATTNDLDPVHAWSVSRVIRWIEGPIIEPAPAPLDRAKIVAKEKVARQEARVNTRMSAQAARADQDLSAADVDLAVHNALSTTAEFFIGEIEDMLFRAKVLNNASHVLQACASLLEPLQRLQKDETSDDQKARVLLYQAAGLIDTLRSDIKASEFDVRTRQRFAQQLQLALSREPMVEGKRHGGVIECALKRSDWPWVAEQNHCRWLPWTRQVTFDGVPRTLPTDQALGLYVTGRSLSGYEFDVSVHLWQRKGGRQSSPGTSLTPFAPMNTADWIDTLTPCAVLHVPSAK